MLVASLVVLLGLVYSVVAVQVADVRLSGVVVVPLAGVYVLYDLAMLPVLAIGVALAYAVLAALRRHTLLWGRSLLVVGVVVGAVVPLATVRLLSLGSGGPLDLAFLGSILPGIAAYNYSREAPEQRRRDVLASTAGLASLLVVGLALVTPTTASLVGRQTPPILFAEWSDVAAFRNARVATGVYDQALPTSVATLALLAGLALAEGAYARWGVRLTGMVAIPLVALFGVQWPSTLVLYAAGIAVVYAATCAVAHLTLLYGRVLLSLAIGLGTVLACAVGVAVGSLPGFVLLFLGVLVGVGGYNVHRVPRAERRATVTISGACVACFVAAFLAIAPDPSLSSGPLVLVAGAATVLAGLYDVVALEEVRSVDRVRSHAEVER